VWRPLPAALCPVELPTRAGQRGWDDGDGSEQGREAVGGGSGATWWARRLLEEALPQIRDWSMLSNHNIIRIVTFISKNKVGLWNKLCHYFTFNTSN
jgi:hypothetical protein